MNRDGRRRQRVPARTGRNAGSGTRLRRLFGALAGLGTVGVLGVVGKDLLNFLVGEVISLVGEALADAGAVTVGIVVGAAAVVGLVFALRRLGFGSDQPDSAGHPVETGQPPGGGQPPKAEPADAAPAPNLPYLDGFVGRAEEVARIVEEIRKHPAVAVVGRRAVGTSYCVIRAANQCRDEFPEGQFYLDLRGGRPWTAYEVIRELARIAGFPPPRSARPDHVADAARDLGRYVNGRSLLLVLDNVDDPALVQPLLPPIARTCRLVLVGGPALSRLPGVVAYRVREPTLDDAERMYRAVATSVSGTRPHHLPPDPVVREIVDLCARHPHAIAALARHGWPPMETLAALRTAADAPAHEPTGESALANELVEMDLAYQALSAAAQRTYRLLSLAPAALDRSAIRMLTGMRSGRVSTALKDLVATDFVEQTSDEHYLIRPLLARYARLHLRAEEPTRRRAAARRRLTRHLAGMAEHHLAQLAAPGRRWASDRLPDPEPLPGRVSGVTGPSRPMDAGPAHWFGTHENLLTAIVEQDPAPGRRAGRWWFRLAAALCGWYAREERLDAWERVCRRVIAAGIARTNRRAAGWMHNQLGVALRRQGRPEDAMREFTRAIGQLGRRGSAQPRLNHGLTLLDQGRAEEAIGHLVASEQHRTRGDQPGRARTDLALGVAYLALGQPETARVRLVEAANVFQRLGDDQGYVAALTNLMLVLTELGEYIEANDCWEVLRKHGDRDGQANRVVVADRAAALLNAAGNILASDPTRAGQAYHLLTEGRELLTAGDPRHRRTYCRILVDLGDAATLLGRPDEAREQWREAVQVSQAAHDRECEAAATRRLAADGWPADTDPPGDS